MSKEGNRYDSLLTRAQCESVLKEKLKTNDFQLLKQSIEPISETRIGFLGEHLRLKCTIIKNNNNCKIVSVENVFLKVKEDADSGNDLSECIGFYDLFRCESDFYQLTKVYQQTLQQTTKWCPEFYAYYDNKTIILEDLNVSGYRMTDQHWCLDLTHCQIALNALAAFHAFSFKLIHENTDSKKSLQELYPSIASGIFSDQLIDVTKKYLQTNFTALLFLLNVISTPKRPIDELQKMLKTRLDSFLSDMTDSYCSFQVINHDDLHTKNLLFKYDKNNQPIECCLLDFQTVRSAPISLDFLLFVLINTTIEFQNEHLESLKCFYYQQLYKEVQLVTGKNVEEIYSRAEFERNCKRDLLPCKIRAAFYKATLTMKNATEYVIMEEFSFGDRTKFLTKFLEDDEDNYRDNMTSVMEDLQNWLIESESNMKKD